MCAIAYKFATHSRKKWCVPSNGSPPRPFGVVFKRHSNVANVWLTYAAQTRPAVHSHFTLRPMICTQQWNDRRLYIIRIAALSLPLTASYVIWEYRPHAHIYKTVLRNQKRGCWRVCTNGLGCTVFTQKTDNGLLQSVTDSVQKYCERILFLRNWTNIRNSILNLSALKFYS